MGSPQLLLMVVWAFSAGVIAFFYDEYEFGPYFVDLNSFVACHGGSINITFDVKVTTTGYNGNLTFPYDMDDSNLLTTMKFSIMKDDQTYDHLYTAETHDIMGDMMKNFPKVFRAFFGAMGVRGKPMPAGTYHLKNFDFSWQKLEFVPEFLHGRYEIKVLQSKNGINLGCLLFKVRFKPVPPGYVERRFGGTKRSRTK